MHACRVMEDLKLKPMMFDSYRDKYENVRMKREDGILEVALHSGGGPLVFNGYVHEALMRAFRDIGDDRENHVVILTGTGDEFCTRITPDGFDFFTPTGYDKILREGTKILENILDIQVPMIAAINGPVTVHSEYALLCDIVIATEDASFSDAPHPAFGIVPGDGVHIVWPEVIGEIRGRYFLLERPDTQRGTSEGVRSGERDRPSRRIAAAGVGTGAIHEEAESADACDTRGWRSRTAFAAGCRRGCRTDSRSRASPRRRSRG